MKKMSVNKSIMIALIPLSFFGSVQPQQGRAQESSFMDIFNQNSSASYAYAGRRYYESLLQSVVEKHWLIQASVTYSFANRGYNSCSQSVQLAEVIFGDNPVILKDILLMSKLSDENKITIPAELDSNLPPDRPATVGVSSVGIPTGNVVIGLPIIFSTTDPSGFQFPPDFGAYRSDQYLAQLAKMETFIRAEQDELSGSLDCIYYFKVPHTRECMGAVGLDLSISSVVHKMSFAFNPVPNTLFDSQAQYGPFVAAPFVDLANPASVTPFFAPETVIANFQSSFDSLEDFFLQGVLEPKCIEAQVYNRRTGLDDISIYGLIDGSLYFKHMDALMGGFNIVFPSGNKQTGKGLWEIELGNGGAYQLDIYFNLIFRTPSNILNPTFYVAAEFSKEFEGMRRIAKRKILTTPTVVEDIPDLLLPADSLQGYIARPYDTYDSSVPAFADQTVPARVKYGNMVMGCIGNYFYGLFGQPASLGVYYDYTYKSKDRVCVAVDSCNLPCPAIALTGNWDTAALEDGSQQRQQRFGWEFVYECNGSIQLSCGSQHVIQGLNVPRNQEFFVSFVANF